MTRDKLKQYAKLKKEQKLLEEKLDKLEERARNIPVIMGKVTGSSPEFPYTEMHPTVNIRDPKQNDVIIKQKIINKKRQEYVNRLTLEIEEYIASIDDSNTRQIIEMVFLQGKTLEEVGSYIGYTKGRISQIISNILKD